MSSASAREEQFWNAHLPSPVTPPRSMLSSEVQPEKAPMPTVFKFSPTITRSISVCPINTPVCSTMPMSVVPSAIAATGLPLQVSGMATVSHARLSYAVRVYELPSSLSAKVMSSSWLWPQTEQTPSA